MKRDRCAEVLSEAYGMRRSWALQPDLFSVILLREYFLKNFQLCGLDGSFFVFELWFPLDDIFRIKREFSSDRRKTLDLLPEGFRARRDSFYKSELNYRRVQSLCRAKILREVLVLIYGSHRILQVLNLHCAEIRHLSNQHGSRYKEPIHVQTW